MFAIFREKLQTKVETQTLQLNNKWDFFLFLLIIGFSFFNALSSEQFKLGLLFLHPLVYCALPCAVFGSIVDIIIVGDTNCADQFHREKKTLFLNCFNIYHGSADRGKLRSDRKI